MTVAERGIRRRQRLFVIFTAVLVLAYARQLAVAPTAGQDFRAFFAAATVAAQREDPYDWLALSRTEQALYNAPAHIRAGDPRYYDFLPYPEGPWLAFALEPLTGRGWQAVYPVFSALMLLAIALGSWLILARLGWPLPQRRLAVALLEPPAARRLLISFAAGSVLAFGAAALALPGVLIHWPTEILSHWRAVQGPQPDIASIHSFYYPALNGPVKTIALLLVLLAGCAYALWAMRRVQVPLARGLTLLLLWFVLLPYVHSFDAILLLPVLAFLLAPDQRGWGSATTEVAVWAFAIVPFAYFVGWHLGFFDGFTAIPIALLLLAWHRRVVIPRPAIVPEVRAA